MEKTIIALWGRGNVGKTTTIKDVFEKLLEIFKDCKLLKKEDSYVDDIQSIIEIDDIKIGIESQGDPNSRIFKSIPLFIKEGCHIIICATRTSGATTKIVKKQESDYEVVWIKSKPNDAKNEQEQRNQENSKLIVGLVQHLLKDLK